MSRVRCAHPWTKWCVERTLFTFVCLAFAAGSAPAREACLHEAAIASAHPLASSAGQEILDRGGNAFDAAVAVAAALAVVEPYGSGLGGGGFWLLHRTSDGLQVMIDGRETAPGDASREMYMGPEGKPLARASLDGAKAAAIPGTPAALAWLSEKYGRLPLKVSLESAIRYAREGFGVDARYARAARRAEQRLRTNPTAAAIFLSDASPKPGKELKQPALARTLEALAAHGRDGFYRGAVAHSLVQAVRAGGGVWKLDDLAAYQVKERRPVKFSYRGATIVSAALPSSGGLTLAQSLNMLESFALEKIGEYQRDHYVIEAMRRAYQDRARYLGDPDFGPVPIDMLLSKAYAKARAETIDPRRATDSRALDLDTGKQAATTHFSLIDCHGNRVAATMSINTVFGSAFVAGETGVLLNNQMDDFSLAPGSPNAYGLVGSPANAIAPGKRPLSSMTPTFVEDERGVLILGTPGGSRIISMVLLAILDYASQRKVDLISILSRPRYHHEYLPDRVEIEPDGFSERWKEALSTMGHTVHPAERRWGNMQLVYIERASGKAQAQSDPRGLAGLLF
jgi:gamma-glutamyltranspeptidase / glutathione hydrolase